MRWSNPEARPEYRKGSVMDLEKLNRWLASVALVLGIVVMLGALYVGAEVRHAISGFGQPSEPAVECWDPGGGEVCAPGGAGD